MLVPGCNSYKQIDCNPLLKLYTNSSGLNDRMVSYDRKVKNVYKQTCCKFVEDNRAHIARLIVFFRE